MKSSDQSGSVTPVGTLGEEGRTLFRLAWPVVLGFLSMMAMGVVDVIMVGRLGEQELAAVSLGHIWTMSILLMGRGVILGIDPIVSQAFGAGDRDAAGRGLLHGLVLAGGLSVPLGLWLLSAESGLRLLGQPEELLPLAGGYTKTLILGVPATLAFMAGKQFLQGLGIMRPAAFVMLGANVLNVGLNWLLMHGGMGLEPMGALGCGWSTTVCNMFTLLALGFVCRKTFLSWWPGFSGALDPHALGRVLRLGLPIGLQMGIEVWAFNAAGLMMGWISTTAIAAHTIALNLASTSFMIPLGISAAASTRVGNLVGAGYDWSRSGWVSVGIGGCVMALSALLFFCLPEALAGIYTTDPEVLALAALLLPVAACFQVFDGVQVVAFGVLRGVGDVWVPSAANVLGYWILGLPLGAWLALERGVGPPGIWMGLIIGLAVVSFLLILRIRWAERAGLGRV